MLFSEQERQIYRCPHTNRDYDPLAVRRGLTIHSKGAFGRLCEEARSPDPVKQAVAQGALIDTARKSFDWKPLDVLDAVVWEALIAFTVYLRGKEKRAQTPPDSVPSTDSPRVTGSTTTRSSP